jgi:hypothetical protein
MVTTPDYEEGRKAVNAVKGARVPLDSAFWAYFADAQEWRLVLTTPLVERQGPRAVYTIIQKALSANDIKIPLRQVTVVAPQTPLGQFAANAVRLGEPFNAGSTSVVSSGNVMVDTRYIYRK